MEQTAELQPQGEDDGDRKVSCYLMLCLNYKIVNGNFYLWNLLLLLQTYSGHCPFRPLRLTHQPVDLVVRMSAVWPASLSSARRPFSVFTVDIISFLGNK